jgi:ABC-type nitrate/sulfonate/bicarbonate transport system permease component
VVAESLIGVHGLGVDFTYAYRLFDMPRAFGSALLIIVWSLVVFAAFGRLETAVHRRFTTNG